MKRLITSTLLCAALAQPAFAADRIKIGFLSTLSGPNSALGVDIRDAFNLALKMRDGKLGGLPVEMIFGDDQLNPDQGKLVAERFIKRDHVDLVTGVVFSNVLLAVAPAVLESKTLLISPNAGPSQLAGEQCNRMFFNVAWQNDVNNGVPGLLATQRGIKDVFVLAPNYQAGRDAINGFKSFYKGKIVDEVYSKLGQIDYSAEIAQIRAAKPSAVFYFLPGGMGVNFIKQFVGAGLSKDTTLITAGVSADEDVIKAVGEPMLGLFNTAHWSHDLDNEANRKFVSAFEKEYGRLPTVYAAQGYDTALLIDAAVRDVKGKIEDKEAMVKALRAKHFVSVRGNFKWDRNNFPIQDWYLRVVGRDVKGRITNKNIGIVAKDLGDPHAAKCAIKW